MKHVRYYTRRILRRITRVCAPLPGASAHHAVEKEASTIVKPEMKKPNRRKAFSHDSLCILITLLAFSFATYAASPSSFYSTGLGYGDATVTGDASMRFTHPAFEMGFDYESRQGIFQFTASNAFDNTFRRVSLVLGGGTRHIKIGTGFIGMESSIPTKRQPLFLYIADTSRYTRASASSIPLFLRIHPYLSARWMMTFDAHYGLMNTGSLTIPVRFLGLKTEIDTEPKHSQDRYGYGASLLWRPSPSGIIALRLSYRYEYGEMNAGAAKIKNNALSKWIQIETPQLIFETQLLMLSVVFVFE